MSRASSFRLSVNASRKELERAYAQGLLRLDELEHGAYYRGECRSTPVARWHGAVKRFVYLRNHYGERVLDEIGHPAQGRTHDLFFPVERVEPGAAHLLPDELFNRHV